MLKFGHFVSWSFCVIFVFKEKVLYITEAS